MPEPAGEAKPKRRRGTRGGRRHKRRDNGAEPAAQAEPEPPVAEPEVKPKRRRGSRGGRRHKRAAARTAETSPIVEPPVAVAAEPAEQPQPRRGGRRRRTSEQMPAPEAAQAAPPEAAAEAEAPKRRRRGGGRAPKATAAETRAARAAAPSRTGQGVLRRRARIPVTGAPTQEVPAPFAHPAEYEFARIMDFYGINWHYEPRSFPLRWDRGHVSEAFTPDFYLPDLNLYVELTTLKTGLTAEKNRKMRLLQELYPEVNVIMLKKRDYLRLLAKYGYGPISADQVPDIDRVLITATKLQQRVGELGAQISRDYAGKEPVLIGVLRGVLCFMADLIRNISLPTTVDLMAISSYDGNGSAVVRILKDLDENIKGRDVILVEDIVDTGMTLNHIIEYLNTKRPSSISVCALLDKRARRIANVPVRYVGFEIPDEFVVGYGLDFHQRFRNLPFVAVLKHDLLP